MHPAKFRFMPWPLSPEIPVRGIAPKIYCESLSQIVTGIAGNRVAGWCLQRSQPCEFEPSRGVNLVTLDSRVGVRGHGFLLDRCAIPENGESAYAR